MQLFYQGRWQDRSLAYGVERAKIGIAFQPSQGGQAVASRLQSVMIHHHHSAVDVYNTHSGAIFTVGKLLTPGQPTWGNDVTEKNAGARPQTYVQVLMKRRLSKRNGLLWQIGQHCSCVQRDIDVLLGWHLWRRVEPGGGGRREI